MSVSLIQKEYISRINRTCDYIEKNIDKLFTLEELAGVANFSKYHFHRVFFGLCGETPFQFIQRIRLEKSAILIATQPNETLSEIGYRCGFTDISVFSRNFKQHFQKTPSQYRTEKRKNSNHRQTKSNDIQPDFFARSYFCHESQTLKWRTNMTLNKGVEIKEFPKMTVAYIRYTGAYKGDEKLFERLWNKLFSWAGPRNLIGGPGFKSLVIYHDSIEITDESKLRMSVCITVPPETKTDGEIGKMELEGGNYVVARFEVNAEQFHQAWQWVFSEWFPQSGYQPDDRPCFELYSEEPKDGKFIVDICVPVKPL